MAASNLLEARQTERREARQEASPKEPTGPTGPTKAGKRGQEVRRKLSRPPCKGESGELTTRLPVRTISRRPQPVEEEGLKGPLTIGGRVWEGAELPPSGARKRKLSRPPPLGGETGELTMTKRLQTGFSRAANESGQGD